MVMVQELVTEYIRELKETIDFISLDDFEDLINTLIRAYNDGKSIFTMGNGGSGSTASHFVCDINKGVCVGLPKKLKVICLNDNMPIILAYANDTSYDDVFVEQLKNFLNAGDVVIGISGSGNSTNVIKAFRYSNDGGAVTVALTGFDGGELSKIAKIPIIIPVNDMQKVEDVHMIMVHMIMQVLYRKLRERPEERTFYEIGQKGSHKYVPDLSLHTNAKLPSGTD